MAELKLIYDDGYGSKTERTITSFRDPRSDYADLEDAPTWWALLKECWDFLNGLGFVISKSEKDYVNDYLENGPQTNTEKCSGCCSGNCEHCQCEEAGDEPTDEQFVDGKCAKCALYDTCNSLDSEDCPMDDTDTDAEIDEPYDGYDTSNIEELVMSFLDGDTREDFKKLMK